MLDSMTVKGDDYLLASSEDSVFPKSDRLDSIDLDAFIASAALYFG